MNITSLSPSMVNTHRICPRRFFYQEVVRVPYLPNPDLAYGAAFHEMARETHYQKIRTHEDLPVGLMTDFFRDDLKYRDVDWSTKSLAETTDEGVISVKAYMIKIAPEIQPAHVEHSWTWRRKGKVTISGKTDLVTIEGNVEELKTTGKQLDGYKSGKPQAKDGHAFQVGTYVAARRLQAGLLGVQGRIVYSIRGKDAVCSIPMAFNAELDKMIQSEFDDVAKWIEREWWMPNRKYNNLCSRRYCNFWNICEQDCGGEVKE